MIGPLSESSSDGEESSEESGETHDNNRMKESRKCVRGTNATKVDFLQNPRSRLKEPTGAEELNRIEPAGARTIDVSSTKGRSS